MGKSYTGIVRGKTSAFAEAMALRPRIDQRDRRARTLLTADRHRRLAALLPRTTAPGRDEQAAHHGRLTRLHQVPRILCLFYDASKNGTTSAPIHIRN